MTILVVGQQGQLARALVRRAQAQDISLVTVGRLLADLGRPSAITALIGDRRPRVVINAGAYTAVDRAEDEPQTAFSINALGAEAVAQASAAVGASLIQVSTDYVYPGDKVGAYVESDTTGPRNVYGASKLDGDRRVLAAHPGAIVVRTAWVFDAFGANFVRTMLRLAKTRPTISVVADQVGCPTFADDLADALLSIANAEEPTPGIFHCAGAGETSWAGFARQIFRFSQQRGGPVAEIRDIETKDYPTRAVRPLNSRLSCRKIEDAYGVVMRPWAEALSSCLDEIASEGWRVE